MTRAPGARNRARHSEIIPLVMRTVAAELRAAGELPAPAHFGLLSILSEQPRTLTELAALQGVSLPTMSNSISAMVERGWVRRTAPDEDRRVVIIEVTATGQRRARARRPLRRSPPRRGARAARRAVAAATAGGLGVLRKVFASAPRGAREVTERRKRRSYLC